MNTERPPVKFPQRTPGRFPRLCVKAAASRERNDPSAQVRAHRRQPFPGRLPLGSLRLEIGLLLDPDGTGRKPRIVSACSGEDGGHAGDFLHGGGS